MDTPTSVISCPLCERPLRRAEETRIINSRIQRLYTCDCHGGVCAWVNKGRTGGPPFVASFEAAQPFTVVVASPEPVVEASTGAIVGTRSPLTLVPSREQLDDVEAKYAEGASEVYNALSKRLNQWCDSADVLEGDRDELIAILAGVRALAHVVANDIDAAGVELGERIGKIAAAFIIAEAHHDDSSPASQEDPH